MTVLSQWRFSLLRLATVGVLSLTLGQTLDAAERPSLASTRITTPFGANGHTSSLDGRLFIGNVYEDVNTMTTRWQVRVMRPEAIQYSSEGVPSFSGAFSSGRTLEVHNGENAVAMCFPDASRPYSMSNGQAVYTPYLIESQMFGTGPNSYKMRRRTFQATVSNPFTTSAEVSSVSAGNIELLTTTSGGSILGIEPTLTSDGRLFIYQGSPNNDGGIDHLMYSYNPNPCATTGWSVPRALALMNTDPNTALQQYPIAWKPLKAATGEAFSTTNPIHGAYPWVDHEGRNVVYMSVVYTDGARREAVSLIGAESNYAHYHIDGGINPGRYAFARLFYSGPMWNLEQERLPEQNFPLGSSNEDHYLPVTKNHDVLPLFGSNTADYNEVDIADLKDPFHMLFLPMNELVTRAGEYDLTRTPDLSGNFFSGKLQGGATISTTNDITASSNGSLWASRARGRAITFKDGSGVKVDFTGTSAGIGSTIKGFTVQLALKPDANINSGCGSTATRYLIQKRQALELIYETDNTVRLRIFLGRKWVDLGKSPVLPKGAWTQLAYTWDGVNGQFREYINGVVSGRSLATATGTFKLGTGTLMVGGGTVLTGSSCAAGGSFVGALDEVRLFSHARSNRSVCLNTYGVSCLDDAIQEDPGSGQFYMAHQQPTCNGPEDLGTLECASAFHRTCAQRGAIDALDSASNVYDTALQLISSRPPVSLAGVPVSSTSSSVTVACAPIAHHSMAVTFEELARQHDGCRSDKDTMSTQCMAASHRWCNALGWTTGSIFEVTSRPWMACFDTDLQQDVAASTLGPACSGSFVSGDCKKEVSTWCVNQGFDGGLIQETPSSSTAHVHCFEAASVVPWAWK